VQLPGRLGRKVVVLASLAGLVKPVAVEFPRLREGLLVPRQHDPGNVGETVSFDHGRRARKARLHHLIGQPHGFKGLRAGVAVHVEMPILDMTLSRPSSHALRKRSWAACGVSASSLYRMAATVSRAKYGYTADAPYPSSAAM